MVLHRGKELVGNNDLKASFLMSQHWEEEEGHDIGDGTEVEP